MSGFFSGFKRVGDYLVYRVTDKSLEPYHGEVHNLEVSDDSSYLVEGVAVHNCHHILYDGKGSKFADEEGVEHKLGELIGHVSVPNSNTFIEASWVRNPAFRGAVRRNFLNEETATTNVAFMDAMGRSLDLSALRTSAPIPAGLPKAASSRLAQQGDEPGSQQQPAQKSSPSDAPHSEQGAGDDLGGDAPTGDQDSGDAPPPAAPQSSDDKLQSLLDKAQEMLMENIVKGLGDKLAPKPEDVPTATPSLSDADLNETLLSASSLRRAFAGNDVLVRWALSVRPVIARGRRSVAASSLTPRDLIVFSWIRDTVRGAAMPARLYQAAMSAGHPDNYPSERSYLAAVHVRSGDTLTDADKRFVARIGRIASVARNV